MHMPMVMTIAYAYAYGDNNRYCQGYALKE